MSTRREMDLNILNAAATTWAWNVAPASDFWNNVFSIATDGWGTAALTVKFQWSSSVVKPNFDAAQSATNMWDYIEVIDLQDWTAINWDTWISVATADDYRQVEANINGLKWVTANVTAITAGSVTVNWYLFSND